MLLYEEKFILSFKKCQFVKKLSFAKSGHSGDYCLSLTKDSHTFLKNQAWKIKFDELEF